MRIAGVLFALALVLGACGDDDSAADDTTTSSTTEATTTTEAEDTTTTSDTVADDSCPDEAPIPDEATDVAEATIDYDGDGDGIPDTLSVFRHDDAWWVQVAWSAGGSAAVTIDEAGDMGASPIGGHDVDGSGQDEAFVSVSGPASGVIVAMFRTDGCSLVPVVDAESGLAFSFPVTASIGTFSGATCEGLGDLDLFSGELVDADTGEYLVAQAPYSFVDGEMVAGPGDAGSVGVDEVHEYSSLDCGLLASGL
jgi:hypothetical protein